MRPASPPGEPFGTLYYCAAIRTAAGTAYGDVLSIDLGAAPAAGCGCGMTSNATGVFWWSLLFGCAVLWRVGRGARQRAQR